MSYGVWQTRVQKFPKNEAVIWRNLASQGSLAKGSTLVLSPIVQKMAEETKSENSGVTSIVVPSIQVNLSKITRDLEILGSATITTRLDSIMATACHHQIDSQVKRAINSILILTNMKYTDITIIYIYLHVHMRQLVHWSRTNTNCQFMHA